MIGEHALRYLVAEDKRMNEGRGHVDGEGDEHSPSGCLRQPSTSRLATDSGAVHVGADTPNKDSQRG
ncbi:hypothetical protein HMPREF9695_01230 [Afipia broomeae ATCC 49717]|uniref:Uncharacterized protein n=1 Tax=Afipia broomeae ATCC 49717 TaxID=883078 RepID=K8PUS1_9BRAD|nr:hypothetical protein HMPREF9695_01230 [Afipia broomeae ATCC 49717]